MVFPIEPTEARSPQSAPEMPHGDAPPATSALARVVHTVMRARDDARILHLGPDQAVLEVGKKATLTLYAWEDARAGEIAGRLKDVMSQSARGLLVVGLVGGGDAARRVLKKARPMLTQVKVGQAHIDDRGAVWTRKAGPVRKALADYERTPPPSDEAWARVVEESAASRAEAAEEVGEAREFADRIEARRPVVTWTLGGLLLAVFALEHVFGGTESTPVLIRMGALHPERVLQGEVWRLLSCTFLHAGPMHLAFNIYVLWALGSFLERVLGSWRFLLLYGMSCIGASLVSLAFLEGFSVGASGGLWGLLGADAVLAWRSRGLLPRAMVHAARRAALINLFINVANSFRPHVDMWAHFGGGAVGAALMLSGALTRGLPRLDANEGDETARAIRTGEPLKLAAAVVGALLLASLGLGLALGQPWALREPVASVRTPLPSLGISLALPSNLELTPGAEGETEFVTVGDLFSDSGAALIERYPDDYANELTLMTQSAALFAELGKAPPGARLAADPETSTFAGKHGMAVRYAYENGVEEELAFVFLDDALIKVNTLRWPAQGDAMPRGYAASILESLQPLPP